MSRINYLIIGSIVVATIFVIVIQSTSLSQVTESVKPNISISSQNTSQSTKNPESDQSQTQNRVGLAVDLDDVQSSLKITKAESKTNNNQSNPSPSQVGCQPANFDPNTIKFSKVYHENLTPSQFYEIDNPLESSTFQIQDFILAKPLTARVYIFGCPSQVSTILEIKSEGKNIALIRDIWGLVTQNMFSSDSKYLYFQNTHKDGANFVQKTQLFDILDQKFIDLGNLSCLGKGFWQDDFLITSERFDSIERKGYGVCIFDKKGQIMKQLRYDLEFSGGNQRDTVSKIRLFGDFIGIYKGSGTSGIILGIGSVPCYLSVYNIKMDLSKEAAISQSDQDGRCADIEIQKLEDSSAVIALI